ncbi:hypothetical protein ACFFX1_18610 [Dactylosporangium sucinum]|uniref:Uncharacterized protein n=1 Tax=Dactylosporangium sucinum TaxID=1424081 RepID=A0A917X5H9_9ACTN|nr:hypothetical protein [Dactylosporangium sucinum]GGM80804.1 hypothetical protein GCM10007977_097860 [Dactylosporangium sucinum]
MTAQFLEHLQSHGTAVRVPRGKDVVWDDERLHAEAWGADPQRYALAALIPGTPAAQRVRVLLQLLLASWAGLDDDVRGTLARVCRVLALGLAPADVLTVLLAVRRRRANHGHVTRTALALLLEHPLAAELVRARRGVAVDCFEHAVGRRTARACARQLAEGRPVRHALAWFGSAPQRVGALYSPVATTRVAPPPAAEADLDLAGERPETVTATNRGDLAATLVHRFRGGPSEELTPAVERYVAEATEGLPRYGGTVALVLDRSASMRGYGDREWAVASQAEAFRLVLERVCARLVVIPVGGAESVRAAGATAAGVTAAGATSAGAAADGATSAGAAADGAAADGAASAGRAPAGGVALATAGTAGGFEPVTAVPAGATDLASGVLDAVGAGADVIAVVSDGYENVYPGDLARVVATLPVVGVRTPVVFCQATFGHADDLSLRRPAPRLPRRTFWHSGDLGALVIWVLSHVDGAEAERWLGDELRRRLALAERELAGPHRNDSDPGLDGGGR